MKLTIEETLDLGLPHAYTPKVYRDKCAVVYEHVHESYPERGRGSIQVSCNRHAWL